MTKYIENNWAKWEANLAPILDASEKAEQSKSRRKTVKMNEYDPNEEVKQPAPMSQPRDNSVSQAEAMF